MLKRYYCLATTFALLFFSACTNRDVMPSNEVEITPKVELSSTSELRVQLQNKLSSLLKKHMRQFATSEHLVLRTRITL